MFFTYQFLFYKYNLRFNFRYGDEVTELRKKLDNLVAIAKKRQVRFNAIFSLNDKK